jgi:hypothetical protein
VTHIREIPFVLQQQHHQRQSGTAMPVDVAEAVANPSFLSQPTFFGLDRFRLKNTLTDFYLAIAKIVECGMGGVGKMKTISANPCEENQTRSQF